MTLKIAVFIISDVFSDMWTSGYLETTGLFVFSAFILKRNVQNRKEKTRDDSWSVTSPFTIVNDSLAMFWVMEIIVSQKKKKTKNIYTRLSLSCLISIILPDQCNLSDSQWAVSGGAVGRLG